MALQTMQLFEPVVNAMVTLLTASLQSNIDQLNATVTDGYLIPSVQQIVPYVPVPSTLLGGAPTVGVQELPADFQDDLVSSVSAEFFYAVVAVVQNADHITLMWQLRRMMQAIGYTVQQDRLAGSPPGSTSIMRTQGGVWNVKFERTAPGPLLGDLDPVNVDQPPRSYLSYTALVLSSKRTEG